MPHRDPATGQFVSGDSTEFDDIETVTFSANVGVEAANLTGATGFNGGDIADFEAVELIDYDEIVDRNEELHLLYAAHEAVVYQNSSTTADGTVAAAAELSASAAASQEVKRAPRTLNSTTLDDPVVGSAGSDDTIDIVGRVLVAVGHGPFSDAATGVGGSGSAGHDSYDSDDFPAEYGRFHPRDELFANGRFVVWNITDAGVHLAINGQHIYGVIEP